METIRLDRLMEFMPPVVIWGKFEISLKDIEDGIQRNIPVIDEVFATNNGFVSDFKTKDWHIGRIIYFIQHPDKIDPISIDNECMNGYILPYPVITDGHHRFLAKAYLKHNEINISYGGREDVLDYLIGNTDEVPYE